ncbi:cation diffusion facilitator family transporter [Angustibacter aerolatus]
MQRRPDPPPGQQPAEREGGESSLTVVVALAANAGIAVAKIVAAVVSGSAAMAAEAAHSVADTANEVLLLIALRRSTKPPDRKHPFGYGPERFFWAFVASVSIFVSGAVFAGMEGVRSLLDGGGEAGGVWLSTIVIAIGFVLEGTSWLRAVNQVRAQAAEERQSLRRLLSSTDDPTVKTVFYEDSAALVGLLLALAGVWLHHWTGSGAYDAIASLLIAATLTVVAFLLARTNKELLVGSPADPRLSREIVAWLAERDEVDAVVDLMTQRIGTDRLLVCARVDFTDGLDAQGVERGALGLDRDMRAAFKDVVEVFVEPVPRQDEQLRSEVRDRYGERVAQLLASTAERADADQRARGRR